MALKVLCDHILKEGRCMEGGILKVDLFLNHQMDPYLMKQTAIEFIRRFADLKINKILTIEASGIAPAVMLGYMMELPVVFAKKKIPVTMDDYYQTEVRSFTKQRSYNVAIYKEYLTADDQEKEFQGGRHLLQLEGISRIESLAIIESLTDSQIKIKND